MESVARQSSYHGVRNFLSMVDENTIAIYDMHDLHRNLAKWQENIYQNYNLILACYLYQKKNLITINRDLHTTTNNL